MHRVLPAPSSQELLGQSSPNFVCSICLIRRQEIVNFMTPPPPSPRGVNFRVKLMYFLSSSLHPCILVDQKNWKYSNLCSDSYWKWSPWVQWTTLNQNEFQTENNELKFYSTKNMMWCFFWHRSIFSLRLGANIASLWPTKFTCLVNVECWQFLFLEPFFLYLFMICACVNCNR